MTTDEVLAGVGPRLRQMRKEREVTLAALSETTGISVSTLSRLESDCVNPVWNCCCRSRALTRWPWTSSSVPRRQAIRACGPSPS